MDPIVGEEPRWGPAVIARGLEQRQRIDDELSIRAWTIHSMRRQTIFPFHSSSNAPTELLLKIENASRAEAIVCIKGALNPPEEVERVPSA